MTDHTLDDIKNRQNQFFNVLQKFNEISLSPVFRVTAGYHLLLSSANEIKELITYYEKRIAVLDGNRQSESSEVVGHSKTAR